MENVTLRVQTHDGRIIPLTFDAASLSEHLSQVLAALSLLHGSSTMKVV